MSSPPYVQSGISPIADPTQPFDVCNKRYADQLAKALPTYVWSQWRYTSTSTTTSRIHLGSYLWLHEMFSSSTTQNVATVETDFSFNIDGVGWVWNGNATGNKNLQLRIHDSTDDNDPLFANPLGDDTWRQETNLTFPKEIEKNHKYWIGVTAPTGVNNTVYTITALWQLSNFNFD